MEKTPRQIEDEFMMTSISVLRHKEHLPPELISEHELRLQNAQEFFDRWGISLEGTLQMPQEEFEMWMGLIVPDENTP